MLIDGVVNVNTPIIPNGIAIQSKYGRNFPQRVSVLSAMIPTNGSNAASQSRVTKNIVPTTAAEIPKISV